MDLVKILQKAAELNASDIFMVSGLPLTYKINGRIVRESEERLMPEDTEALVLGMYHLAGERDPSRMLQRGDDDFSFSIVGISRFRTNVYRQRGSLAAVIRVVAFQLPDPKELGIPDVVLELGDRTKGLILVTGPAGSGKSTTLACIIDRINRTRNAHVITLEDPIEYLHRHDKSIISQREVATDTESYMVALRASLRQAPDVILLGEMRDYETMGVAMTAAETGHLVISTLHTMGVVNTIDRIIDAFPPNQQGQIRVQLSMVLQAVVSQQLIGTVDGEVAPVFEVMMVNPAIRNMIRESKIHQIDNVVSSGQSEGMLSMDASLLSLYQQKRITAQDAVMHSISPELMERKIAQLGAR
ncbi:PilT/PilU family type 4a pilus ATPase [Eubacteriales bacterium OttesenSCG-928-M02]|nr:PilT/PilU family type 4a pilus ATPase [Eubacteriales bacterium OttesenSCG-928-M02]